MWVSHSDVVLQEPVMHFSIRAPAFQASDLSRWWRSPPKTYTPSGWHTWMVKAAEVSWKVLSSSKEIKADPLTCFKVRKMKIPACGMLISCLWRTSGASLPDAGSSTPPLGLSHHTNRAGASQSPFPLSCSGWTLTCSEASFLVL